MYRTIHFLIIFSISSICHSQDTIKLSTISVTNIKHDKIKKEIEKSFRKNYKFSNNEYLISFKTKLSNNNYLIDYTENNAENTDEDMFNKTLSPKIKSAIQTNYFDDIDSFNSPMFLLTSSRFYLLKINDYINSVEIKSIETLGNINFLKITATYKDYYLIIILNKKSRNILSIDFNNIKSSFHQNNKKTVGTTKYLNSSSNYEISYEKVSIKFDEIDNKIFLNGYEHNMNISNYNIKIYEQNKLNNLILDKNYSFNTINLIKKN